VSSRSKASANTASRETHAASFAILVYDVVVGEELLPRGLRPPPCQSHARAFMPGPSRARRARQSRGTAADVIAATGMAPWSGTQQPLCHCASAASVTGLAEDDVKRWSNAATTLSQSETTLATLRPHQTTDVALARADAFASLGLSRRDYCGCARFFRCQACRARWSDGDTRPRACSRLDPR